MTAATRWGAEPDDAALLFLLSGEGDEAEGAGGSAAQEADQKERPRVRRRRAAAAAGGTTIPRSDQEAMDPCTSLSLPCLFCLWLRSLHERAPRHHHSRNGPGSSILIDRPNEWASLS